MRMLIVGAGIAGLAGARALRQRGFTPEVVERETAWDQPGTGIYLPGNALRALRGLGLEAEVARRAVPIPSQRYCDRRGRVLADVDLPGVWRGVGACVALPWRDLHDILLEGAADVPVRLGVTLRALERDGATVRATFSDGSADTYDLVVGADGIRSAVRALAFDACAGAVRPVGQVGWRFVTADPVGITTWSVLLGRDAAFLTIPMGGGRVYCYADTLVGPGAEAPRDAPVARLRARFSGFAPPAPEILARLADDHPVHVAAIEEVVMDSWVRGPVVLVGDAAHATSPNMAAGAAMALEDALVLADALAGPRTVGEALAAFEARRRPRTDWVTAQTHRRDRTRTLPAAVRDLVLRSFGERIYRANYAPLLAEP